MLNMVFTNNRTILLIFQTEFRESVLDSILHTEYSTGPPWLGPEKNFQIVVFKWLENAILRLAFANTIFDKGAMLQLLYAEYA